ncbi:hypothetical protein SESBI_07755 [Sesbania bispinosa]|nr:hypothetical protein SESBI_07755 [Sesbania bispinosa]
MRKKRSKRTKATPQGEPPALWMALGSDPGMGKLNWLPVESQPIAAIKSQCSEKKKPEPDLLTEEEEEAMDMESE